MLRALFKQGSFWTITNEKTFRNRGSGLQDYVGQLEAILDEIRINQDLNWHEQRKRK